MKISKAILKMWKEEFQLQAMKLDYSPPEHFTRCHWQKSERVLPLWLIYRSLMTFYFLTSLIYTIVPFGRHLPEESCQKYMIFLTHWTYVVEVIAFVLSFIIVVLQYIKESKGTAEPRTKMPWYYKMYWVFYTVALPCALVVSIIFWATVYDPELFPISATNLIEHAFNSFMIFLDFWLMGHPIRFMHVYMPAIYALMYTLFNLGYYLAGGTGVKGMVPIYKILDWRKPGWAIVTCVGVSVFLLFLHLLFSSLSLFKFWIKAKKSGGE